MSTEKKAGVCPIVKLNDGVEIPQLGFGVYLSEGQEGIAAMQTALSAGYRHIDSAIFYENEAEVGSAVRASKLDRKNVFVTSKLWSDAHGARGARGAVEASLREMKFGYIDLYLIHSPHGGKLVETYKELLKLKAEKKIRSVGVSNFGVQHLEGLAKAGLPPPSVNQVELHPWLQQSKIVNYCRKNKIAIEAYSPLSKGRWLRDRNLVAVAKKAGVTPAQALIRWSLQRGFIVLPKSANPGRIRENFGVLSFALDDEAMAALDKMDSDRHCTWDPTTLRFEG